MKNTVGYEWSLEMLEGEDIVDSDHADTLSLEWLTLAMNEPAKYSLCLVRTSGNDSDGVTDRTWAYVTSSQFPSEGKFGFPTATVDYQYSCCKIPASFVRELAKIASSLRTVAHKTELTQYRESILIVACSHIGVHTIESGIVYFTPNYGENCGRSEMSSTPVASFVRATRLLQKLAK